MATEGRTLAKNLYHAAIVGGVAVGCVKLGQVVLEGGMESWWSRLSEWWSDDDETDCIDKTDKNYHFADAVKVTVNRPEFVLPDTSALKIGDEVMISNGWERIRILLYHVVPGQETLKGRIETHLEDDDDYDYSYGDVISFKRRHVHEILFPLQ